MTQIRLTKFRKAYLKTQKSTFSLQHILNSYTYIVLHKHSSEVITFPNGHLALIVRQDVDYVTFYLSSSGIDTSICGDTINTACKTLEHVLSLYYNTSPEVGLELITSDSLNINQQLVVTRDDYKCYKLSGNFYIRFW